MPPSPSSSKRRAASSVAPARASARTAVCLSATSRGWAASPRSARSKALSSSPRRSASVTSSSHAAASRGRAGSDGMAIDKLALDPRICQLPYPKLPDRGGDRSLRREENASELRPEDITPQQRRDRNDNARLTYRDVGGAIALGGLIADVDLVGRSQATTKARENDMRVKHHPISAPTGMLIALAA